MRQKNDRKLTACVVHRRGGQAGSVRRLRLRLLRKGRLINGGAARAAAESQEGHHRRSGRAAAAAVKLAQEVAKLDGQAREARSSVKAALARAVMERMP